MNPSKRLLCRAAMMFALLAGVFLAPAGRTQSQSAGQAGSTRYLLIFNTSADMKKRLPAVQLEVNQLLATSLGGRLQPGDSVGVWTFDQDLHTGQLPLQYWRPDIAVTIASDINKFVGKQRYANRTRFDALQPQLNQVIQSSGRLTVLIFCDGDDEIHWTPYDDSINQVFRMRQAEQKKAAQPFVLVLRTQLGHYTGCTMNFPPGMVNVPDFPPLPAPAPPPAPTNPPPTPAITTPAVPPPTGPPLIIVGTNVMTNWPPSPASIPAANAAAVAPANPTPSVQTTAAPVATAVSPAPTSSVALQNPVTPPSAKTAPAVQTNVAPSPPTNAAPLAEAKAVATPATNPAAAASAAAPPPEESGSSRKSMIILGVALLILAMALGALAVFRHRRADRGSLITRSMRKD